MEQENKVEVSVDNVLGCWCKRFSCESVTIKGDDGLFAIDRTRRFRFVKDEEGAITNKVEIAGVEYRGGHTQNNILDCEIKDQISSYVYEYRDELGCRHKIKIEQEKEIQTQKKKERKKKPKKKKVNGRI